MEQTIMDMETMGMDCHDIGRRVIELLKMSPKELRHLKHKKGLELGGEVNEIVLRTNWKKYFLRLLLVTPLALFLKTQKIAYWVWFTLTGLFMLGCFAGVIGFLMVFYTDCWKKNLPFFDWFFDFNQPHWKLFKNFGIFFILYVVTIPLICFIIYLYAHKLYEKADLRYIGVFRIHPLEHHADCKSWDRVEYFINDCGESTFEQLADIIREEEPNLIFIIRNYKKRKVLYTSFPRLDQVIESY